MALFKELQKRKTFVAFLKEARADKRHTQLDLMGYLIMPVQRVPRYVMLLQDMVKHTTAKHPDHAHLTQALAQMQATATLINEMVPI